MSSSDAFQNPQARPAPLRRNDSSSSDEDGLVSYEEEDVLEQVDVAVGAIRNQNPNNEAEEAVERPHNEVAPRFNGDWDADRTSFAKKIGFVWSLSVISYLFVFTAAYIGVLIEQWGVPCERKVHSWSIGQIAIQSLMIGHKTYLLYFTTKYVESFDQMDPNLVRKTSILLFINRLLNFFWTAWWITGIVFRFGRSPCDAEPLLSLILVQFIIQWCLFGLSTIAVIFTCCFLCCLRLCFPNVLRSMNTVQGATHSQIRNLKVEDYNPSDTDIKTEDALCSICLATYEKADKLRHLPCRHHFHRDCIDQWLLQKKSCPLCNRLIDSTDPLPPVGGAAASATAVSTDDVQVPLDLDDHSHHQDELGLHEEEPSPESSLLPATASSSHQVGDIV